MNYLVTGGAGFIGSHITEHLILQGHEVIILDNFFSGRRENISDLIGNKKVTLINGSITDSELLKSAFKSVDGIFHEAAITSVSGSIQDPVATNDVNITGTLNVLIAARDAGVKKVVFASSASVYGDAPGLPKQESMNPHPKSPYAISKLTGEYYMDVFSSLYGIRTLSLRYFNVFGPRQDPLSEYAAVIPRFITRILSHRAPVIFGDGTQTRDFIYVKDVAEANLHAMESTAEGVCNIAYGQPLSLNALADQIMKTTGHFLRPRYEPERAGDIHDSFADCSRAIKTFGYAPRYSVETGVAETIQWFQREIRTAGK
jgi:UDP-glucose 4-epimerase